MGDHEKDSIIMQDPSRKGAFPRVLCFIHKTISAAFAEEEAVLLEHVFLQLFWIGILHLVDQTVELMFHLPLGFQKNPVKVGKDPDMGHINQTSGGQCLPTATAFTCLHGFILLGLARYE